MAKMNIYVTDDLRRRMDEVEEVNWSALAARAFEAKLAEIVTTTGGKDMRDVVARLRASKAGLDGEAALKWIVLGREWAQEKASFTELCLLDEYVSSEKWNNFFDERNLISAAERLAMVILGGPQAVGSAGRRDFVEMVGLDGNETAVRGFASGALEVWRAVKDQL